MDMTVLIQAIIICFLILWSICTSEFRKKMNIKKSIALMAEAKKGNIEAGTALYFLIGNEKFKDWLNASREILGEQVVQEMNQAVIEEIINISITGDLSAKIKANMPLWGYTL